MLCSQLSRRSGVGWLFVASCFVPEGQLDSVPESELVVDNSEIVLNDMLCGSNGVGDFTVLKSLGDEFDNSLLSFTGNALSVPFVCEHNCLRYKSVASFTRLIPPVMPKRKKRRLKWALTVLRAILSCFAISALSQPWSSSSAICCSLGPSRIGLSFITTPN